MCSPVLFLVVVLPNADDSTVFGVAGEQEHVLTLEYVEAMQSSLSDSRPHPDWISAVDGSHPTYVPTHHRFPLLLLFFPADPLSVSF
jgi:hypothetical protein